MRPLYKGGGTEKGRGEGANARRGKGRTSDCDKQALKTQAFTHEKNRDKMMEGLYRFMLMVKLLKLKLICPIKQMLLLMLKLRRY